MADERLRGNLEMLILATLARGSAHGYALAEALRTASDGEFDVPEGSLYPALHRLERTGSIASEWEHDGRRRRVYAITPVGAAQLTREAGAWQRFADGVASTLAAPAIRPAVQGE
ncbi:helix-turn-helix transcriptional regulator [Microbacterium sp. 2MCAF23]|uniref:helix-turn-helix transcriptional regulator n=1 Tax=Microbacterium sp. 2MCAF23 TaxID=3232985 RepID=UPI003F97B62F